MQQKEQKKTKNLFIGREREIAEFRRWLVDSDGPSILYFHDAAREEEKKGGVGKTWLLGHFAELAQQEHPSLAVVMVDFFNVADRDRIVIAERVVAELETTFSDWTATAFKVAVDQYRARGYLSGLNPEKDVADIRIRDTLSEALAADLRVLASHLEDADKALLLLFDTFELIEQSPVIAVLGVGRTFPDNYGFKRIAVVIAGRNGLDWSQSNWYSREKEVRSLELAPFDEQEMLEYLDEQSVQSVTIRSEQAHALHRLTEGRPILIGLATDVLNHRVMRLEDLVSVPHVKFEERLVTEINHLENPLNRVILFMAHVYHRFNMSILDWIVREGKLEYTTRPVDYAQLVAKLPSLSFVRRPNQGDDFVLHDEMRRLVTKYCWEVQDTDQRYRRDISHCVISYCEQALAKSQSLSEQERQIYIVEKLHHLLFLDLKTGLEYFQQQFTSAVDIWSSSFARSLLQEASLFFDQMSSEQSSDMLLAEMKLLRAEENPAEALKVYQQLEEAGNDPWLEVHRSDLLLEQGRCYLQLSQFAQAIESLESCLKVVRVHGSENRLVHLLGMLGYTHRRRGQLDAAMRYYDESVSRFQKSGNNVHANLLNNISNVHRLQGRIEEALRVCKMGEHIRRSLFQEGKINERFVGLSLSTMGMIYLDSNRIVQAEQVLREAFEIYTRTGYKKGIAAAYVRLGQVQMAKDDLVQARDLFEKARAISTEVDSEQLINSLNKQGRILMLQNQWDEAATFFQRAIQIAEQVHDYYQQMESLIDLAQALEYLGQHASALPLWQEAQETSKQENYLYLLGRIEEAKGEVAYKSGDYKSAFVFYREYCHYMAHYNMLEYNRAIAKISDELLNVPSTLVPAILDTLISSWSALGMANSYPQLIEACEEMKKLMV